MLERWHLFMARWRAAGLHDIHGDIVLDRQRFQVPQHDPAAFDGRSLKPYNAGPDALLLNHRALILRFRPDDVRPGRFASPWSQLGGMALINRTRLVDSPTCGDWREALTLSLQPDGTARTPERQNWRIEIKGPLPTRLRRERLALLWTGDNANDYAERLITGAWGQMGGHLNGSVRDGAWPAGLAPWMSWSSPPNLGDLRHQQVQQQRDGPSTVPDTGDHRRQRPSHAGAGSPGGQPAGAEPNPRRQWQVSLRGEGLVLDNGSGLSRQERASARCVARWLRALWASPLMPEFVSSLPGGRHRWHRPPTQWRGWPRAPETGSLDGVSALAGIADGESGQRYVVVGVVNGPAPNTHGLCSTPC